MPKIDPVTGCKVMTMAEFWQAEGKAKGTSAGEEMMAFYEEWAKMEEEDRQRLLDPKAVYDLVHSYIVEANKEDPENYIIDPVRIERVLDAQYHATFRSQTTKIVAEALKPDGSIGIIEYNAFSDSGSRLDPPDGDVCVEWK